MARAPETEVEIVDDSEKEKEELRRRARLRGNAQKRPPCRVIQRQVVKANDVIELTDDESESSSTPSPDRGSLFSQTKPSTVSVSVVEDMQRNALSIDPVDPINASNSSSYIPGLKRFVFAAENIPPRRVASTSVASNDKVKKESRSARAPKQDYLPGLDLQQLTRCVSCEVQWTTRKTTAHKLVHLRSCAKKHLFTEETVGILVKKEIEATVLKSVLSASPRREGKNSAPPQGKRATFLEDVLRGSSSKKSKQDDPVTVKNLKQSRQAILNKAGSILGPATARDPVESFPTCTQALGIQPRWQDPLSPPNLTFGKSVLASMVGGSKPLFDAAGDAPFSERYATQSEQPVSLSPPQRLLSSPEPMNSTTEITPILISYSESELTLELAVNRGAQKSSELAALALKPIAVVSPSSSPFQKAFSTISIQSDSEADEGEAFLHYNPSCDSAAPTTPTKFVALPTMHLTPNGAHTAPSSIIPTLSTSPPRDQFYNYAAQCLTPSKPSGGVRKSYKTKKRQQEIIIESGKSPGAWESVLRERILHDVGLYHRILRYEPIPLNTFVEIVTGGSVCSPKGKTKLRGILDKLAINFYETERQR